MSKKDFVIPSNPADRKKIYDALTECMYLLEKIDLYKDSITDIINTLQENYDMPKSLANKMVKTMYSDSIDSIREESDLFDGSWEMIVKPNRPSFNNSIDNEKEE